MQFSDLDSDQDMNDTNGWVFGYSHVLADNVVVYAEHGTTDSMDEMDGGGEGDHDSRGLEGRLLTENVRGLATKMWIDCGAPSEAAPTFFQTPAAELPPGRVRPT